MNLEKIINNRLEMMRTSNSEYEISIYCAIFSYGLSKLNGYVGYREKINGYLKTYNNICKEQRLMNMYHNAGGERVRTYIKEERQKSYKHKFEKRKG